MIYEIKIEQKTLLYIKYILSQQPFCEVSNILNNIESQQMEQDSHNALRIDTTFLSN